MIENFHSKVMLGMSVIGEAFRAGKTAVEIWPFIVTGVHDLEIKCAFFYQSFGSEPISLLELETPKVLEPLDRLKEMIRESIRRIFEAEALHDKENTLKQLAEHQQPHYMGTVAEIAAKFGISKSEVRRRKVDGTLHEFKSVLK